MKNDFEMSEIWLPVYGWENYYEVSSLGNMRRIERVIIKKNGKKNTYRAKDLKPSIDSKGYLYIKVHPEGAERKDRKNIRVHRIVMSTFCGPSNLTVDHINRIRADNRLENLRYVSLRENSIAASPKNDDMIYITHLPARKHYKERWAVSLRDNNGKKIQVGSRNCLEKARKLRNDFILKNGINCLGIKRNT